MPDDRGEMRKLSHKESGLCGISHVRYSNNVIERLVLSMKTPSWCGIRSIRPKVDSPEAFSHRMTSIRTVLVFGLIMKTWIATKQALGTELRPSLYKAFIKNSSSRRKMKRYRRIFRKRLHV